MCIRKTNKQVFKTNMYLFTHLSQPCARVWTQSGLDITMTRMFSLVWTCQFIVSVKRIIRSPQKCYYCSCLHLLIQSWLAGINFGTCPYQCSSSNFTVFHFQCWSEVGHKLCHVFYLLFFCEYWALWFIIVITIIICLQKTTHHSQLWRSYEFNIIRWPNELFKYSFGCFIYLCSFDMYPVFCCYLCLLWPICLLHQHTGKYELNCINFVFMPNNTIVIITITNIIIIAITNIIITIITDIFKQPPVFPFFT